MYRNYKKTNKNYLSTIIAIVLSILVIGTAVVFAVPESRNAVLDFFEGNQVEQEATDKEPGDVEGEDNIEDVTPEGDENEQTPGEDVTPEETLLAMFY